MGCSRNRYKKEVEHRPDRSSFFPFIFTCAQFTQPLLIPPQANFASASSRLSGLYPSPIPRLLSVLNLRCHHWKTITTACIPCCLYLRSLTGFRHAFHTDSPPYIPAHGSPGRAGQVSLLLSSHTLRAIHPRCPLTASTRLQRGHIGRSVLDIRQLRR